MSDMDVDGSGGGSDFRVNEGIIISDGTRTWCTEILALGGLGAVTVKHTPAGLGPFTPGGTVAVPAIIYENDSPNLTLTRNGQVLSTTVEDLQVEYWVDAQIPDETTGVALTREAATQAADAHLTKEGWSLEDSEEK